MKHLIAMLMLLAAPLAYAEKAEERIEGSGVYWVPVSERQMSRYAVFSVESVEVKKFEGRVKIQYSLPLELTGDPNYLEFEGPAPAAGAPLVMTGAHGSVTCPSSDDFSMCETNYKNLSINPVTRSEFLREISRSELELQIREAVAQSFCVGASVQAFSAGSVRAFASGGEPCGFLRLRRSY